jgi:molybdate transport system regulatory protein
VNRPQLRFRIDFGPRCSLGPGKIALLESIDATGSLSKAARRERMSYRRAWLLLDDVNRSFARPASAAAVGGRGGGGMQLTAFGKLLIERYRALERAVAALGARRLAALVDAARNGSRGSVPTRSLKRRPVAVTPNRASPSTASQARRR